MTEVGEDERPVGERRQTSFPAVESVPNGEQLVNVQYEPRRVAYQKDQNVAHKYRGWNNVCINSRHNWLSYF